MATGKTSRTFGWILMGLVMVGLVGFGSTNFGGSTSTIATVGKTEVDARRYMREMQSELNAFQAQTGQAITMDVARSLGLDQTVLARVLATAALEDETARLGISVGDKELRDRIVDISSFKGPDGKFDRESYNFALNQSGLSAPEFEKSLRDEVSRQILQAAVANGIETPASFVDTIYAYARETRDFTWGVIGDADLKADVPAPSEAELVAYYEAHPNDFTLPETKQITYAWLNPEDLIPSVDVDEAQIAALYEERAEEYLVPERRIVERLGFATVEQAQKASDQILAGETTFDALVEERNLNLSDIDLGDMTKDALGTAGNGVFALTEPGVTGPLDSDLGPALYRMNAILAARETSFDDAKAELHAELASDAARRQVSDMITELDDEMAGGTTIEELANAHDMRKGTMSWTKGGSDGIAAYDAFRKAAQTVTQDDFPEITLLADGGVFALRLDELQPPRLQEQSEVQQAVIAGWTAQKRQELLVEQAQNMIAKLEAGESLASLGYTEIVEKQQAREAFIAGVPVDFMTDVFDMQVQNWRVLAHDGDVVMVRLDAINAPDQNSDEAKTLKENFARATARDISVDVENAFSKAIQARAGIVLNRDVLNAVNAQIQ